MLSYFDLKKKNINTSEFQSWSFQNTCSVTVWFLELWLLKTLTLFILIIFWCVVIPNHVSTLVKNDHCKHIFTLTFSLSHLLLSWSLRFFFLSIIKQCFSEYWSVWFWENTFNPIRYVQLLKCWDIDQQTF